jgi:hypothetical protein
MKLRALRSSPAALASDQLIAIVHRPDQDRLEHAALGNRRCQLGEGLFLEDLAWLGRIWPNTGDVDRPDTTGRCSRGLGPDAR